jgi:hypothetical protein
MNPNRQLVGKSTEPSSLVIVRADGQRRQIAAWDPVRQGEVAQLLVLGGQPRPPGLRGHGVEEHPALAARASVIGFRWRLLGSPMAW